MGHFSQITLWHSASSKKKEPAMFAKIVKERSLKHPADTDKGKGKEHPSMSKWPVNPLYKNDRRSNETNTVEKTQLTEETPL